MCHQRPRLGILTPQTGNIGQPVERLIMFGSIAQRPKRFNTLCQMVISLIILGSILGKRPQFQV